MGRKRMPQGHDCYDSAAMPSNMSHREQSRRDNVPATVIRHLVDAIEKVREDVAKVELWAAALDGFLSEVPDYDLQDAEVSFPREQASLLQDEEPTPASASAHTTRHSHRGP
jgi:hypothetical protein